MDLLELETMALSVFHDRPENQISAGDAIRPELAGMRIFDPPLIGTAAADDPLFRSLRDPAVVGPDFLLPRQWLPEARSVLAFFLPFTKQVRQSNVCPAGAPSDAWLHARIEGQIMVQAFGEALCALLRRAGFSALTPSSDPRFQLTAPYVSNWSERHAAYVCGLGTFGLSRGLITKKGVAGRFGSLVTSAPLPPSPRPEPNPFAFCTMCGACQRNCPAGAIDKTRGVIRGKDQVLCEQFLQGTRLPPHGPHQRVRFGCGKCQVNVPCEHGIPLQPHS